MHTTFYDIYTEMQQKTLNAKGKHEKSKRGSERRPILSRF